MQSSDWYYCLDHHTVEPYEGCRSASRLGPYRTLDDAWAALTRVAERNQAWDHDPRFTDDDAEAADDESDQDRPQWGPFGG
jgi:pterin-4a-carbinolamine dehydratase